MLYALIDIGSATIRMAIYDIKGDSLHLVHKRKHTIGLAAYVKDEVMQPEGINKACEILQEFSEFLQAFQITKVEAFTTAALRNCKNSKEAVAEIISRTGIDLHVISGDAEATYDFVAITHGLDYTEGYIMDIGGASTEVIHFTNREIQQKISLPIGSLALHSKFVDSFLPTKEEVNKIRAYVQEHLSQIATFPHSEDLEICGIGGTFKGASFLYKALFAAPEGNTHIPTNKISEIIKHFTLTTSPLSEADIITLLTTVPDRLRTVIPGLVIAEELASYLHAKTINYRDAGMREGFIYTHIIK